MERWQVLSVLSAFTVAAAVLVPKLESLTDDDTPAQAPAINAAPMPSPGLTLASTHHTPTQAPERAAEDLGMLNIRAGLDLPFRALSYAAPDGLAVTYTSADFLRIRHDIDDTEALTAFDRALAAALAGLDSTATRPVPVDGLSVNHGILELRSPHDVAESVARLRRIVKAQSDTVWFGDIDFAAEAAAQGVDLPPAVLLLFGGPAPGGVAMAQFPSIGVDAFCQKLLVYAHPDGGSVVIYNSITALAELHYGASAPPHQLLDERLTATFVKALE